MQDHGGLIFLQPVPQPRPRLQQHLMCDLGTVGVQDHETGPRERVEHRVNLGPLALGAPPAQIGSGDPPADGLMILADRRQLPEHLPRDRLLVLGQPIVDCLGADLYRARDPAGPVVALGGQLAALPSRPGRHHGLRKPGEYLAGVLAAGRTHIRHDHVDESAVNAQAAHLGRSRDRASQPRFGHRADHELSLLHGPDELRVGRAPVPVVPANRDHDPGWGLGSRPGRFGRGRAHRADERASLQPAVFAAVREDLLELVDDQDQRCTRRDLTDQQVSVAWRVGEKLPDRAGVPVA